MYCEVRWNRIRDLRKLEVTSEYQDAIDSDESLGMESGVCVFDLGRC